MPERRARAAKIAYTKVGFILMKRGVVKVDRQAAEHERPVRRRSSSIGDTLAQSSAMDTAIAAIVAITNAAVAQITRAITSAPIRSMSPRNPVDARASRIIGAADAKKVHREEDDAADA